jgi:hypothetical protein
VKRNYAPVPKTGQTTQWGANDDGTLQKGVAWPTPRFTDNDNGTVTDNLTGLIWTKNANMFGALQWQPHLGESTYPACEVCSKLNSGEHGLTDGSVEGDWRLPNIRELQSLIDYGKYNIALPYGNPFENVQADREYWSSTTHRFNIVHAWAVWFVDGLIWWYVKDSTHYVWCVRGGQ